MSLKTKLTMAAIVPLFWAASALTNGLSDELRELKKLVPRVMGEGCVQQRDSRIYELNTEIEEYWNPITGDVFGPVSIYIKLNDKEPYAIFHNQLDYNDELSIFLRNSQGKIIYWSIDGKAEGMKQGYDHLSDLENNIFYNPGQRGEEEDAIKLNASVIEQINKALPNTAKPRITL